ncbi:MAG: hypothetical protein U0931_27915 [Vulcanimicrobiota bacterium]
MKRVMLLLALAASLSAEPIFVRNRPFKGPASGNGPAMVVGLKEMAQALELNLVEKNGGYLIDSGEGEPKEGEVLVNGKSLLSTPGETGPTVNLKEFAEAAGLVYRPNKAMGTIDISRGSSGATKVAGIGSAATGTPGVATVFNQNPGSYIDLKSLVTRGSYTVILLYKDGYKDAGYKQVFSEVDAYLKNSEVVLYKVNIGQPGSPMSNSLRHTNTPQVLVFDKGGGLKDIYNGHSILGSVPGELAKLPNINQQGTFPWSQIQR